MHNPILNILWRCLVFQSNRCTGIIIVAIIDNVTRIFACTLALDYVDGDIVSASVHKSASVLRIN
jgi:hypothetical protein